MTQNETKTIAICGCPRSGNTAITKMINTSTKAYIADEVGLLSTFNCESEKQKIELFFTGKDVIGDKTPSYVLENHFSYIRCHHPDVKFIFSFRRCEDVITSSLMHGKKSGQVWAHDDLNTAIAMWDEYVQSTIYAIESLNPNQFCAINFEQETDRRIINKIENLLDKDLGLSNNHHFFIRDKYYKQNYHLPIKTLILNRKIEDYI